MEDLNTSTEATQTTEPAIAVEPVLAPVTINWIPMSVRFPDYSGDYLLAYTSSSKHITIAYFSDIDNVFYHKWTKGTFKSATYWASLPKAPNH